MIETFKIIKNSLIVSKHHKNENFNNLKRNFYNFKL